MKKRILIFTFLIAALFCLGACGSNNGNNNGDDNNGVTFEISDSVFTSFTAEDFDGNTVDESLFNGYKVTMIYVWGSFCHFCLEELPVISQLNAENGDKGFQAVGIPMTNDRQIPASPYIEQMIEDSQANFRHLKISDSIRSFIDKIFYVPYVIFVNNEGYQIGDAYVEELKIKEEWQTIINDMLEFCK